MTFFFSIVGILHEHLSERAIPFCLRYLCSKLQRFFICVRRKARISKILQKFNCHPHSDDDKAFQSALLCHCYSVPHRFIERQLLSLDQILVKAQGQYAYTRQGSRSF